MKFRIKEVAKMKNISIKEMAEKMGIHSHTISYYNSGDLTPPIKRLEQIAEILDCDVLELLNPSKEGYGHFYVDGVYHGVRKI